MRLPILSRGAEVTRLARPTGGVRPQGLACNDACLGLEDSTCPARCPCTQTSPGVWSCHGQSQMSSLACEATW